MCYINIDSSLKSYAFEYTNSQEKDIWKLFTYLYVKILWTDLHFRSGPELLQVLAKYLYVCVVACCVDSF